MSEQAKKLSLMTFVGITMALCANVRSVPTLAAAGWQLVAYLLFAIIFVALPLAAMCGELSSMLPGEGGLQLWVSTGLNDKWGFMTSWIVWAQLFPGMVLPACTLGPLLGNSFGNNALGTNHWFIFGCIIVFYWILTILNLKFDMAKFGGKIGVWLGVYLPCIMLLAMGSAAALKVGINPAGYLGTFSWQALIPNLKDVQAMHYLAGIVFIFVGIEMSSVYVPQMAEPAKYVKGVFISVLGLIAINLLNGLLVANIVPKGTMELTNITQPIRIECQILGLPEILANIFAFMVFLGVLLQLSAWVTGPMKTMIQCSRQGLVPKSLGYYKVNKYGVSRNVVLTQSIGISLFACLYAVLDDVNGVFMILTNATTIVYCFVYVLIALAFVKLRYDQPTATRAYKLGGKGNGNFLAWLAAALVILGIGFAAFTVVYTSTFLDNCIVIAICALLLIVPLLIYAHKKPEWIPSPDEYYESEEARETFIGKPGLSQKN